MSVSESVCLFVCLFPNSSETANPSELKFLRIIPLGMRKVLGLQTSGFVEPLAGKWHVYWHQRPHSNLTVNIILSNVIWEVGRGWPDGEINK